MSEEELVAEYDSRARHADPGIAFLRDELVSRETARLTEQVVRLTRQILWLTGAVLIVAVATLIATVLS